MATGIIVHQVTVTDAATQLVAAGVGRVQLRLRWPVLQNNSPALGPDNTVTQNNGYRPIVTPQGPNGAQEYVIPTAGAVWAVVPQGNQLVVDVMEVYT
jgi:hypothetical protein